MLDAVRRPVPGENRRRVRLGRALQRVRFQRHFQPRQADHLPGAARDFDKLLADQAALQGVDIRYGETIVGVDLSGACRYVHVRREDGSEYRIKANFVLDASGYGRVLPRLLDLEAPSNFPVRQAVFTHVEDRIDSGF
jgi:2-polyprenyl-6-methoxyphenol hydroxylase-like FAD-dependent oxidoreductase